MNPTGPSSTGADAAAPAGPNAARRGVHLRPSDLREAARLAVAATESVIGITEGMHQSVLRALGAPEGVARSRTAGLTGFVYRRVRGITAGVGRGLDAALAALLQLLPSDDVAEAESPERAAVLSALNGVLGDRLAAQGSALAIPMQLRRAGQPLALDAPDALAAQMGAGATGTLFVLVHGLCMGDAQWRRSGTDHGVSLAAALGGTAVYLHYNTGLHISDNGGAFAVRLEQLLGAWPRPVRALVLIGHSMGGLVMRSALQAAQARGLQWPKRLRAMVFLGTPHHGAPLERAGHGVDLLLAASPWTAPLKRLGEVRSAGITDLRYGALLASDWQGADRFASSPDRRTPVPLPSHVACFTVAGTLSARRSLLAERLLGDGLVPLASALGEHPQPRRHLRFPKAHQFIAWRTGHLELLASTAVRVQLQQWLGDVLREGAPRPVDDA